MGRGVHVADKGGSSTRLGVDVVWSRRWMPKGKYGERDRRRETEDGGRTEEDGMGSALRHT